MAKRFTDTNKWRKDFIRGLQGAYKLLWLYILDECDHAGIWHVELDVASLRIGHELDEKKTLEAFNGHIVVFDKGHKWFIPDFIDFQYGVLNPENRAHNSVLELLEKYKLKGHLRGLQGRKDKEEDKEQDMDMVKEESEIFEIFRISYPGTKRGHDAEFENLKKKHKDWKKIIPLLSDSLNYQKSAREIKRLSGGFIPEWKNLQTWINQKCWEEEIETNNISNGTNKKSSGASNEAIARIIAEKFGTDSN
jgi:hypothetical protein